MTVKEILVLAKERSKKGDMTYSSKFLERHEKRQKLFEEIYQAQRVTEELLNFRYTI